MAEYNPWGRSGGGAPVKGAGGLGGLNADPPVVAGVGAGGTQLGGQSYPGNSFLDNLRNGSGNSGGLQTAPYGGGGCVWGYR